MGLFDKFKIGLGKSSDGLSTGFKNIFLKPVDSPSELLPNPILNLSNKPI